MKPLKPGIVSLLIAILALVFVLPAEGAGRIPHPSRVTPPTFSKNIGKPHTFPGSKVHTKGSHTTPRGKLVGDPTISTNWSAWFVGDGSQFSGYDVADWGGNQVSNDWPQGSLTTYGVLTVQDQTADAGGYTYNDWQQTQTCQDVCNLDLTSANKPVFIGDTYLLKWHMEATLNLPGWTWGDPSSTDNSTGGCVDTTPTLMTCDYVYNQVLIQAQMPAGVIAARQFSGDGGVGYIQLAVTPNGSASGIIQWEPATSSADTSFVFSDASDGEFVGPMNFGGPGTYAVIVQGDINGASTPATVNRVTVY